VIKRPRPMANNHPGHDIDLHLATKYAHLQPLAHLVWFWYCLGFAPARDYIPAACNLKPWPHTCEGVGQRVPSLFYLGMDKRGCREEPAYVRQKAWSDGEGVSYGTNCTDIGGLRLLASVVHRLWAFGELQTTAAVRSHR
jgi:hypothetical protein